MSSQQSIAPLIVLMLAVCLATTQTRAQTFGIDWHTVDGGGGTSTGSVYSVSGTIGQPDAGKMSGGNFTVDGGFWGIIAAVPTPGAPLLKIALNLPLATITISWAAPSTGFSLQQNPLLGAGNWVGVTNVPSVVGGENRVTVSPPVGNHFYRLNYP